jgi:hypothetical protein
MGSVVAADRFFDDEHAFSADFGDKAAIADGGGGGGVVVVVVVGVVGGVVESSL